MTTSDLKNYKQITRPSGVQIGRGDSKSMHGIMGRRPDYDFYVHFLWSQYGTTLRRKVYQTILKKYSFVTVSRDETNEDNWIINLVATNYLSRTRAYATEKKRTRYLQRRKSQSGQDNENADEEEVEENDGDGEEPDEEDTVPGDGEDDYAANAPAHGAAPRSSTGHDRNKSTTSTSSRSTPSSRSAHSSRPDTTSHGSTLPTQTSNRDNRRADMIIATEEALDKADDARASKSTKAASTSKSRGKRKQVEMRPTQKDAADDEESGWEEEALRLVPVKVSKAARAQATINSPEPTLPTQGQKREAAKEPEPIQEPAPKK
ncbi:hypothetical protein FRC08_016038 [Ceratobasidium sp. 394]|nr:hypothetical protein FRC08_016038 [Ceratobasidium sp. 394]